MIIGIDIGVRNFAIASLGSNGELRADYVEVKKLTRWNELSGLVRQFDDYHNLVRNTIWIEEPPLAGSRNVRVLIQLAQTAGALMAASNSPAYFVAVTQWKKRIVGKGNASKEEVSKWLEANHPTYYMKCNGNQNLIDATCIALYGQAIDHQ